ncbi:pre-rRNA processing protein [Umbelopsis nana]
MSDSFFATTRKRKKPTTGNQRKPARAAGNKRSRDTNADDSDNDDQIGAGGIDDMELHGSDVESEEEIQETAAEKRIRLAKGYLEGIKKGLDEDIGGFDAADIDRDLIAERLKQDAFETTGKLHRRIADKFDLTAIDVSTIRQCRGHQLAVTGVAMTENGKFLYTASKDGSIIKWDALTMTKLHTFPGGRKGVKDFTGHTDSILCLALSSDGQYLASGGKDKAIHIWSVAENKHIVAFKQHKDSVASLSFRKGANQLYSASHDRTVKLWNVDERSYIETLFGHQDQITDIDTLARERCVTTGGRDKTARMWKIVEESQLVFRGGATVKEKDGSGTVRYAEGCLDCIALVDEEMFLTGGDSGSISLWDINRKKPVFTYPIAHGINEHESESEGIIGTPYWITALATLPYSDIFASGSWDGFIRLWKIASNNRNFTQVGQIPVVGVINDLQILTTPTKKTILSAGVGQEMSQGRWIRLKKAKNGGRLLELPVKETTLDTELEEEHRKADDEQGNDEDGFLVFSR